MTGLPGREGRCCTGKSAVFRCIFVCRLRGSLLRSRKCAKNVCMYVIVWGSDKYRLPSWRWWAGVWLAVGGWMLINVWGPSWIEVGWSWWGVRNVAPFDLGKGGNCGDELMSWAG